MNNTWRDSIVIDEEHYREVLERLEAEWANETYEETMRIFNPSPIELTSGNCSPDSNNEV